MTLDDETPAEHLYSNSYELIAHTLTEDQRDALREYEEATYITPDMLREALVIGGDDMGLGRTAAEYGPELAQKELRDWFDALTDWHQALDRLASLLPNPSDLLTVYLEQAAADFYSALNAVRRTAVFYFLGTAGPTPEIDDRKLAIGGHLIALDACATAEAHQP